jgi:hypothetical protein
MNDLEYVDTLENGNTLLFYPHDGVLYYFQVVDRQSITLHNVDTVGDTETDRDVWTPFEGLPASVRKAIIRSDYRMRNAKGSLEGAMSA